MELRKSTRDLDVGEIVAEDIYDGYSLILKIGSTITKEIKKNLIKRKIKNVLVYAEEKVINKQEIAGWFNECVGKVCSEKRYGYSLHDEDDMDYLKSNFVKLLTDTNTFTLIKDLREYDKETFYHCFDVFSLVALYLHKSKFDKPNDILRGCLLHDIGKINVPLDILNKKGNLTNMEFKEIQNHTVNGEKIAAENGFSQTVQTLIRSHHERLDGSGYPDMLDKSTITPEVLKVLMVADVYSALTLARQYRSPMAPKKVLEILLSEREKFDYDIIVNFMNLLKIYPVNSIVELSNGNKIKIKYVYDEMPYRPLVKLLHSNSAFQLPKDLSISLKHFNKWDRNLLDKERKQMWKHYVTALYGGEKDEALYYFETLCDNHTIEDIYINIIGDALKEIGEKWEKGEISIFDEHIATAVIREIMDVKLSVYKRPQREKGKIVITVVDGELHSLPAKILADCCETNGWYVICFEDSIPSEELIKLVNKHQIKCLGLSATMQENLKYVSEKAAFMKKHFPDVNVVAGGGALTEVETLENVDYIGKNIKEFIRYLEDNYYIQH